jgi:hypothetical protein
MMQFLSITTVADGDNASHNQSQDFCAMQQFDGTSYPHRHCPHGLRQDDDVKVASSTAAPPAAATRFRR